MKPHNTTATTIPEQFNRLPEPWRSKAIARCEDFYGKKLDGKPFSFLSSAFPWCDTPEGEEVWKAISERGEFPPSAPTPEARLDILESRIAVLEGLVTKPKAPDCGGTSGDDYPSRASAAATLTLRVGGKYRTRDGRTAVVEHYDGGGEWPFKGHVTPPTAGPDGPADGFRSWRPDGSQAYDRTRESRTDLVEEIVEEPAPPAPPHDEVAVDTSDGDGYPSTPPDPGPGYRLLQKGDPIVRGKAEAWHPDEGWYRGPVRGWEGDTFDPDTDYWFREPAPHAYRLLNPGEIILASDEVYLRGEWEEMAGDTGVGEAFDPEADRPIRRRIKSYEDA